MTLQEDQIDESVQALRNDILNRQCLLNVELVRDGQKHSTLLNMGTKEDIAQGTL